MVSWNEVLMIVGCKGKGREWDKVVDGKVRGR